jgi:hypothetical protein
MLGITWVAEQLAASQEGLSSMKLVTNSYFSLLLQRIQLDIPGIKEYFRLVSVLSRFHFRQVSLKHCVRFMLISLRTLWVSFISVFSENPAMFLFRYVGQAIIKLKSSIFLDITLCSSLKISRRFGGTCRLHVQGRRIIQARNQHYAGS